MNIIDLAESKIGCPYIWGAAGPDRFDCSGFITWLLRMSGQWSGPKLNTMDIAFRVVPALDPSPGDIAVYRTRHVMLYYGDGMVMGASGGGSNCTTVEVARKRGAKVHVKPMHYRRDLIGIGRWIG